MVGFKTRTAVTRVNVTNQSHVSLSNGHRLRNTSTGTTWVHGTTGTWVLNIINNYSIIPFYGQCEIMLQHLQLWELRVHIIYSD